MHLHSIFTASFCYLEDWFTYASQVGAESVNLVAGDRPADVYSVIADRLLMKYFIRSLFYFRN